MGVCAARRLRLLATAKMQADLIVSDRGEPTTEAGFTVLAPESVGGATVEERLGLEGADAMALFVLDRDGAIRARRSASIPDARDLDEAVQRAASR